MTTERQLSTEFHHFWSELLPLLTPAYVSIFNHLHMKTLPAPTGRLTSAPRISRSAGRPDLIAELAFHLARIAFENKMSASKVTQTQNLIAEAICSTKQLFLQYEGTAPSEFRPRPNELQQALRYTNVYVQFLSMFGKRSKIEFAPRISGSGFMNECRADLAINDALFEIKTVNRNIAGKDIRQLIIYLALQASTGKRRWKQAGFFNPRRAVFSCFSVDTLVNQVSGGRVSGEVFTEIIDFLSGRDAHIETLV